MIPSKILTLAANIASESSVPLDRLPYTEQFDSLYDNFLSQTRVHCSKNQFWLYLLSARKRGLVGPRNRARPDDQHNMN